MAYRLTSFILASGIIVGCASNKPNSEALAQRSDLLETFNRVMFIFNYNVLDPYVMRPIAVAWRDYMPMPVRTGLSNFLGNLEEPASAVNSVLVGDPRQAVIHFTRFFLNSLLGLGGFIDVARKVHLDLAREIPHRFGSTLGYYGIGYGPYIELPLYGGFTIRQDGGYYVDTFYPVLIWLTWPLSIIKWTIEGVEMRARLLESDEFLKQHSDPYIFIRNAYFQHYNFLAKRGHLSSEENPNASAIQDYLKNIDSQ
ncbi:phospholipid-binding lipoprotein MlaA [Pantoea sp. Nvir]|uniref:phospholipid-binding lipoprotein MlaA n=1 Tax=Pantoea sp. Nvir TaxID=2576760 RepID=UPI00135A9492|nr:phospholipid-binding lipoprotein MlaA [Pantoea sp. Nvir]MXP66590.1 phospholipid-binding lipoprotein MlaA [Pantoea sp. Nvir]CAJ0992129.1 Intermembrane phospholipid transport system lipoprotein MlaA [Pantoea sp. Nvir]